MKLEATKAKEPSRRAELSKFGLFLRRYFDRDAIVVLMVAWVPRLLYMLLMPPTVRSMDAHAMETIANVLEAGGNPYQVTTMLNWPPLWMQLDFVLSKISIAYSIPFFHVLQMFLMLVESAVIVL